MDIELNYKEKGKGDILILLHGNGENLDYFENQIKFFSNYFRVIAIDTRGHGKTQRGIRDFSYNQFVEDLKEFLDLKDIRSANILGFSDGGITAILFVLKYPKYIKKIILNGASLNPRGLKLYVRISILVAYLFYSLISIFNKKIVIKKDMFKLMINEPNIDPKNLSKINNDALIIVGKNDMIKEEHTRLIAKSITNSKLSIIEGDHFIASKNSSEFNKIVLEFLDSQF